MTDTEYRVLYDKNPNAAQIALYDEYLSYVYAIVYNKLRSCGSREDMEECVGDVTATMNICTKNMTGSLLTSDELT